MSAEIPKSSPYDSTPYDTLVDDNGDVVIPDTYDEHGEEYDFTRKVVPEVIVGPSVRLDDRALALNAMRHRFAEYAQAKGFKKASIAPETRPELRSRIANLDRRADDMLSRTSNAVKQSEQEYVLKPILQRDELLAAGFPEHEVDTAVQQTIHSVRAGFGSEVGSKVRNRNARSINPGTSKKE